MAIQHEICLFLIILKMTDENVQTSGLTSQVDQINWISCVLFIIVFEALLDIGILHVEK